MSGQVRRPLSGAEIHRRDRALDQAVRDGKFTESRRAFWAAKWNQDPEGTARIVASLVPGRPRDVGTGWFDEKIGRSRDRNASAKASTGASADTAEPRSRERRVPADSLAATYPGRLLVVPGREG